jgi:cellulose synthase/poly-beta-1,6-N-acetylglucosamine synthase-like glycosyltransferase
MTTEILKYCISAYEIFVSAFSGIYILIYIILAILSYSAILKHVRFQKFLEEETLFKSNYLTGVSVVAPAYNEGVNIVYNVRSLLSLTYPKYEVIIVNDGSTDDTLQKLITEFELVKVDFYYEEHIPTKSVRGHYKSKNPIYS